MRQSNEQNGQGASYPMMAIKLPMPVSFYMLPRWLRDITHEIRTCINRKSKDWGTSVVCFKPVSGEQIILAEKFAIEIAKICEEEREKQQEQGENHERE